MQIAPRTKSHIGLSARTAAAMTCWRRPSSGKVLITVILCVISASSPAGRPDIFETSCPRRLSKIVPAILETNYASQAGTKGM